MTVMSCSALGTSPDDSRYTMLGITEPSTVVGEHISGLAFHHAGLDELIDDHLLLIS